MKKIISAFMAACVLLSAFPITAFAANGPSQEAFGDYYLAYLSGYDVPTDTGFRLYDPNGEIAPAPQGISYDLATNTVTLDSFKKPGTEIYANMMGDDFTIRVNGECELGRIIVYGYGYGGSLTVEGSGTLTVNADNKNATGISLNAETSNSVLTLGENVKLKVSGKRAVVIDSTPSDSLDKAVVMKNGASLEEFTSERIEYDDAEYVEILQVEEGWTRLEGYKVTCASDPDGIYCVKINNEGGKNVYLVKRFSTLGDYDVLTEDISFESRQMTEEEFESSEYSLVTDELPVRLYYTNREYEKERRGWMAHAVINKDDPDGVYAAGFAWNGSGSTDRDPDEYIIYRLLWDETEECYVQDVDFEIQFLNAEEFAASQYELVYEDVMEPVTVRYWYENEPGENNFEANSPLLFCSQDPDGTYVLSGTYESTDSDGQAEQGYIVDELYYDEENDCNYRDPNGELGTHTTYYVNLSEFEELGFSQVYTTSRKLKEIRYINDDYFFEEYAFMGYRATHAGDPGAVYAARPYTDEIPPSSYRISRLVYDEAKARYYEDDDFSSISLDADELDDYGYTLETTEQPIEFISRGLVNAFYSPIYTDKDGNRYLVIDGEVYEYGDFSTIDYFGKEMYVPVRNTEVSADDLTITDMHYVTDFYNYFTDSDDFIYNFGEQPDYLLGDVDGDGDITINDATMIQYHLAALLQTPLTEKQMLAADYNKNGFVDIGDATMIQYLLADLL